ncbi:hypothetical protein M0534_06900 [Methylonatrum kenyense]|uniref:hypothetical protein n=1 Tax=Methylonatrum kenyense TaxID=455253 RepID=UPI0020BE900F|nr:hypothetical protein [Methylonatrum kenyense]MCK8516051.1 hypothetical protein [Methylonatrum kenyense]
MQNSKSSRMRTLICSMTAALAMAVLPLQADWPEQVPEDADGLEEFINARYDVLDAELEAAMNVAREDGKIDVYALDEVLVYSMSSDSSDQTYAQFNQRLRQAAGNDEIDNDTLQRLEELASERKAQHEEIGNDLVAALMQKMAETGAGENQQAQAWLTVFALFALDFTEAMKALDETAVRAAVTGIEGDLPPQVLSAARSAPEDETRETAFLEVMQSSAEAADEVCMLPAQETVPSGREDTDHLRGMLAEHCKIIIAGIAVGDMPNAMLSLYQAAGWDETMGPVMDEWVARLNDN